MPGKKVDIKCQGESLTGQTRENFGKATEKRKENAKAYGILQSSSYLPFGHIHELGQVFSLSTVPSCEMLLFSALGPPSLVVAVGICWLLAAIPVSCHAGRPLSAPLFLPSLPSLPIRRPRDVRHDVVPFSRAHQRAYTKIILDMHSFC